MSRKSIYKNSYRETFAEIPLINNLSEKIEREANIEYYKMRILLKEAAGVISVWGEEWKP